EVIDIAYGFYLNTVDKFTWGRRYLSRAFFEEVCPRLGEGVEVVLARDGPRALGGAFNLAGPEVLYGRYWGAFEERPFLHFNVCFYPSIEECILRKKKRFEPGAGGMHKLVRGFEPCLTHSAHHLTNAGLARAIGEYLVREREVQLANAARGD